MLVLSRKVNEEVLIGRDVRVRLLKVRRGRVHVGIVAPRGVEIRRAELPSAAPAANPAGGQGVVSPPGRENRAERPGNGSRLR